MASQFDEAFTAADDILFDTFGEKQNDKAAWHYYPPGSPHGVPVSVVLHRDMQMVGAAGAVLAVKLAADLRRVQVDKPMRGGVLRSGTTRYVLEEGLYSDAHINRYSLNQG